MGGVLKPIVLKHVMAINNENNVSANPASTSNITLVGDIVMSSLSKTFSKLTKCGNRKTNVTLAAEKITSLDTAGIQVLMAFVKQVKQNKNSITWRNPSQELLIFSEHAGLKDELGLPK